MLKIKRLDKNANILIVGLGLMGGSYAKALTKAGYKVFAITKNQADIDYALSEGFISGGTSKIEPEIIKNADIAVLALYPHTMIEWIEKYSQYFSQGALVTDVTGVKGSLVDKVQSRMPEGVEFIAAHPMAGREKSGVENSDESVFKGANYIVVPTEKNTQEAKEICCQLGHELGFYRISTLSVQEHDSMVALLSQLTHCIAVALMDIVEQPGLEAYTGDSFRDLTRIARINDEMWSELFLWNKDALLNEMGRFETAFDALRKALKDDNREEMRKMMRLSSARRERFDKPVTER